MATAMASSLSVAAAVAVGVASVCSKAYTPSSEGQRRHEQGERMGGMHEKQCMER